MPWLFVKVCGKAALQSKGIAATAEVMQVRCPKCGTRWRMRADQLR